MGNLDCALCSRAALSDYTSPCEHPQTDMWPRPALRATKTSRRVRDIAHGPCPTRPVLPDLSLSTDRSRRSRLSAQALSRLDSRLAGCIRQILVKPRLCKRWWADSTARPFSEAQVSWLK